MEKINALLGLAIILLAVGNVVSINDNQIKVMGDYGIEIPINTKNSEMSYYESIENEIGKICNISTMAEYFNRSIEWATNMSLWGLDENVSNKTRDSIIMSTISNYGSYWLSCQAQKGYELLKNSWMSEAYLDCKGSVISDITLLDENNRLTLENQKLREYSETQKFFGVFLMSVITVIGVLMGWMVYHKRDKIKIK